MEREVLQGLFCEKIALELEKYKKRMLKKEPEIILSRAYQIDMVINIYEVLMEKSQELSVTALKAMLVFPNLLAHFYLEWLDYEDCCNEELRESLSQSVKELMDLYRNMEGKEKSAA